MERFFSGIVEFFDDIISNPWPYILIALWIIVSWILTCDNEKSFVVMLFKSLIFFLGLLVFHAFAPAIFWIVVGLTIAISVFLAIKGG